MKSEKPSDYLNVDLEIESPHSLELFLEELGDRVMVLYSGPGSSPNAHFVTLENSDDYDTADEAIQSLCDMIDGLSPEARQIWDAAVKVFDVGYMVRGCGNSARFMLQSGTTERLSMLRAALAFTCYCREIKEAS